MTHSIDHQTLRKAAEQLRIITEAGYFGQLERELSDRITERGIREREQHQKWNLKLAINEVDTFERQLAAIVDCPLHQAHAVALDLLGYAERREVAIELLREMSQQVRQLQARSHKQFARRRIA